MVIVGSVVGGGDRREPGASVAIWTKINGFWVPVVGHGLFEYLWFLHRDLVRRGLRLSLLASESPGGAC